MNILRLRMALTFGILLLVSVWPIVHMTLSRSGKFSSWRYGGLGMYATPNPEDFSTLRIFYCHLSEEKCRTQVKKTLALEDAYQSSAPILEVYIVSAGEVQKRKVKGDLFWQVRGDVGRFVQLNRPEFLQKIAAKTLELDEKPQEIQETLAVLSEQRIDLQLKKMKVDYSFFKMDSGIQNPFRL